MTDTASPMERERLPLALSAVAGSPHCNFLARQGGRMDAAAPRRRSSERGTRRWREGWSAEPAALRPAVVRAVLAGANPWREDLCDDELTGALDKDAAWIGARHGVDPVKWS